MIHVLLLRDENCQSCEEVMEELRALKEQFPEMRIRERLIDEEPEIAARMGVTATPAVVVNDQLAFQGHPDHPFLWAYFKNVREGRHDDPEVYPPEDERDPEARGQEATGSADPAWRGSGRRPSFGGRSHVGGRH
jgi:hypothetical protein